jgi:23S rRNA (guanine745-N1)-methyltransferase
VLDALPDALGVALDSSAPALRRAARAHPRAAAVRADVWREIPLRDATADLVLIVFSPRNGAEVNRALAPGGAVVVVTPTASHLHELGELTIGVEAGKQERLRSQLAPLEPIAREHVEFVMDLDDAAAQALVAMGPSAHHRDPAAATGRRVTASVNVETFSRVERPVAAP